MCLSHTLGVLAISSIEDGLLIDGRIRGGGGPGGPDPPPFAQVIGFLTLGLKLDPPPLFACKPSYKMDHPFSKSCAHSGVLNLTKPLIYLKDDWLKPGGGGNRAIAPPPTGPRSSTLAVS